jgi:hypothetical protein
MSYLHTPIMTDYSERYWFSLVFRVGYALFILLILCNRDCVLAHEVWRVNVARVRTQTFGKPRESSGIVVLWGSYVLFRVTKDTLLWAARCHLRLHACVITSNLHESA